MKLGCGYEPFHAGSCMYKAAIMTPRRASKTVSSWYRSETQDHTRVYSAIVHVRMARECTGSSELMFIQTSASILQMR